MRDRFGTDLDARLAWAKVAFLLAKPTSKRMRLHRDVLCDLRFFTDDSLELM